LTAWSAFAVAAISVGALLPSSATRAQDAQPCESRRPVPTEDDGRKDITTFLLTRPTTDPTGIVTELTVTVTRFGPPEGAVGVRIDSFDLSAEAGIHYVGFKEWIRWDDGEVGTKTKTIEILDHDPDGPERVFGVAKNDAEPSTLAGDAIFEFNDQIDVYIPGSCPLSSDYPPATSVAPVDVTGELPETGRSTGSTATTATLLLIAGVGLTGIARRRIHQVR